MALANGTHFFFNHLGAKLAWTDFSESLFAAGFSFKVLRERGELGFMLQPIVNNNLILLWIIPFTLPRTIHFVEVWYITPLLTFPPGKQCRRYSLSTNMETYSWARGMLFCCKYACTDGYQSEVPVGSTYMQLNREFDFIRQTDRRVC